MGKKTKNRMRCSKKIWGVLKKTKFTKCDKNGKTEDKKKQLQHEKKVTLKVTKKEGQKMRLKEENDKHHKRRDSKNVTKKKDCQKLTKRKK